MLEWKWGKVKVKENSRKCRENTQGLLKTMKISLTWEAPTPKQYKESRSQGGKTRRWACHKMSRLKTWFASCTQTLASLPNDPCLGRWLINSSIKSVAGKKIALILLVQRLGLLACQIALHSRICYVVHSCTPVMRQNGSGADEDKSYGTWHAHPRGNLAGEFHVRHSVQELIRNSSRYWQSTSGQGGAFACDGNGWYPMRWITWQIPKAKGKQSKGSLLYLVVLLSCKELWVPLELPTNQPVAEASLERCNGAARGRNSDLSLRPHLHQPGRSRTCGSIMFRFPASRYYPRP